MLSEETYNTLAEEPIGKKMFESAKENLLLSGRVAHMGPEVN